MALASARLAAFAIFRLASSSSASVTVPTGLPLEVDPRRAGLERLQIAQGTSVRFQCARNQARPKLRVLGDDVVVDADLERLTWLAKAVRKELGELGNALVDLESPRLVGSRLLQPHARFSEFNTLRPKGVGV
jgi:hypothetical protein